MQLKLTVQSEFIEILQIQNTQYFHPSIIATFSTVSVFQLILLEC